MATRRAALGARASPRHSRSIGASALAVGLVAALALGAPATWAVPGETNAGGVESTHKSATNLEPIASHIVEGEHQTANSAITLASFLDTSRDCTIFCMSCAASCSLAGIRCIVEGQSCTLEEIRCGPAGDGCACSCEFSTR